MKATPFRKVQPALAVAVRNLDKDPGLAAMAEAAGMSRFHLHRLFVCVASETPKRYSVRLRLGLGAAMLLAGGQTVLQVSLACGFESHEGFIRAFRRQFGLTPSAYRARGFAAGATQEQAGRHRELVEEIGPCVRLYHITQESTQSRSEMSYSIIVKDVSPQPVVVERRRISRAQIPTTIGQVISRLFQFAQQEGIALTGKPFTRYLSVGPGMLTIEPGMRVAHSDHAELSPEEGAEPNVIRRSELPGGRVACTIHAGPYEGLHEAYAALEAWIESSGMAPTGAPWESYITDPAEHPDPQDWLTEVSWPVG